MNVYKHTVVSFAVSALLLITFKKMQMAIACFLSGILIDVDHVFDYYMNHELKDKLERLRHPRQLPKFLWSGYTKHNTGHKVYKLLHSVELLIVVPIFYILGMWNIIATGVVIGFTVHIIADAQLLGHIGAVSLIYKIRHGFSEGADILKQRLSKIGRDVNRCQSCGARGETVLHRRRTWCAGFTGKSLDKITILCPDCRDQMNDKTSAI